MADTFTIEILGFMLDGMVKDHLPPEPGILTVYTCTFDEAAGKLFLHSLVDVVATDDLRKTIYDDSLWETWDDAKELLDRLCFGHATIEDAALRRRIRDTIVYTLRPTAAPRLRSFEHDDTILGVEGKNRFMEEPLSAP